MEFKKIDTTEFMKSLHNPEKVALYRTFRIEEYSFDEVCKYLAASYNAEVLKRNNKPKYTSNFKEQLKSVANWLISGKRAGLMIYGTIGTGKTTLARAIVNTINILYDNELTHKRKRVSEVTSFNLTKLLLTGNDWDEDKFESYKKCEMLFIDDLGLEHSTVQIYGNQFNPMVDLLFHRHDRQLFTICTSNLDLPDLGEKYGDRTGSRFGELFNFISMTGEDFRGKTEAIKK